jgi:GWxTD domain-containing protein
LKVLASKWFVVSVLILLTGSCITVYETINNRNFAKDYDPGMEQMHPEFVLYNASPNDLRLYFRLFPGEFAYGTSENDTIPHAQINLFYRITETYSSVEIIDSLTRQLKFQQKIRPQYLGYLPVHLEKDGNYVMEVFVSDMVSNQFISKVIEFEYVQKACSQNFLALTASGTPLYKPYFAILDTLRVRVEILEKKGLRLNYYALDTVLPQDPDKTFAKLPAWPELDSSWTVAGPDTALLTFSKTGLYYFTDTAERAGKLYLCGKSFYPYVKTAGTMLKPLYYLATTKELNKFKQMDAKMAVDSFWIERAEGQHNKARELIRVFYNRVQLANYFFTDYREGYLTDRGMIYIICGAPGKVSKTDDGEYWIYGRGGKDVLEFYFYKEKHPIFGTAFNLERSDAYSRMWYTAIATWRDGRVFSLNP